jgi:hypothetical protein
VLAVRANHTVTTGSGRTMTAAKAARMILARAWQRVRTGGRDQGHPPLRLGDARGDQRRHPAGTTSTSPSPSLCNASTTPTQTWTPG